MLDVDRRERIKWPKANEISSWSKLENAVLNKIKTGKKGEFTVEEDLQRLSDGIYNTGLEEFGILEKVVKKGNTVGVSRRRKEIEQVKKEKKRLITNWLAAREESKSALLSLYEDIKKRLRKLMRIERKLERRKKKKSERRKFSENPFKFTK